MKKVFIRSGIRYDYLLADKKQDFLEELCRYHVSGQLKIAPEHVAEPVLACMGKPGKDVYLKFVRAFNKKNKELQRISFSSNSLQSFFEDRLPLQITRNPALNIV